MQARTIGGGVPGDGARVGRRSMASSGADYARLTLEIQRLLDADAIETEGGEALLAEAEAARRLLEAGDNEAARQRAERVAILTVALVGSGELGLLDGRAVIETVGRALADGLDRTGRDRPVPSR